MTAITFQDGKVVMRGPNVGGEQGCCCGQPACDCGSCALVLIVNGNVIPIGNGNPVMWPHTCGEPCAPTCEELSAVMLDNSSGPACTATNQNLCQNNNDAQGNPMQTTSVSCGSFAYSCLYCGEDGLCVRLFFLSSTTHGCNNGQLTVLTYRARYGDYKLTELPPCDGSAVMPLIGQGDYPALRETANGCGNQPDAEAGPCGGCEEDSVVQLSCNPFP